MISSTEVLIQGTNEWYYVEHLPTTIEYLRGVSLNNNVILTGGKNLLKIRPFIHCVTIFRRKG